MNAWQVRRPKSACPLGGPSRRIRGLAAGLLLCAVAAVAGLRPGPARAANDHPFRVAFSHSFFSGVTDADATAAVVAWQETILKPAGVPFNPHPMICDGVPALVAALQSGEVDAVALQFTEYAAVPAGLLEPDWIYVNERRGGTYEQYVLLVAQSSGLQDVRQLRGRKLNLWDSQRSCLALPWLNRLLGESGQVPADRFLGDQVKESKPAKVILPVFFGQADVCLVTRSSFADMSELNPQVGKQLRILAASPEVVPAFLCFRKGYTSRYRPEVEKAIQTLHTNVAGKQVLMVFGCDQITRYPGSCLQSAWDLLKPRVAPRGRIAVAGVAVPGLNRPDGKP
jgi:ABC-type phosphate/phosphonate transport system substrate-binding protein